MGHDITASTGNAPTFDQDTATDEQWEDYWEEGTGDEVAYIRFSMGNYNSYKLYSLLGTSDCHAGVSGDGSTRMIPREVIDACYFESNNRQPEHDDELDIEIDWPYLHEFFKECKEWLDSNTDRESILIYFG